VNEYDRGEIDHDVEAVDSALARQAAQDLDEAAAPPILSEASP
jgi:hypothetical protein